MRRSSSDYKKNIQKARDNIVNRIITRFDDITFTYLLEFPYNTKQMPYAITSDIF